MSKLRRMRELDELRAHVDRTLRERLECSQRPAVLPKVSPCRFAEDGVRVIIAPGTSREKISSALGRALEEATARRRAELADGQTEA
jgi:hypothetical protein